MRNAKVSLHGKWKNAALVTFVYTLIIYAACCTVAGALIIAGPLILGYFLYIISVKTTDKPCIETLFDGFKDFVRSFIAGLLLIVFIFLWTLLLVIPGIIMSLAYSMTFFILTEDKEISAYDAINRSKDMMRGYKWKYFCLQLRFTGWLILCMLTLGILTFWVQPYMTMASLNFYNDIKADWDLRNSAQQ
jgi:uncharacterized membrane protein